MIGLWMMKSRFHLTAGLATYAALMTVLFVSVKHNSETKAEVIFTSPTECKGHASGVYRWIAKIDESRPPDTVEKITCRRIGDWSNPTFKITETTLRIPEEMKWYRLTAQVVLVKAEEDGDLHVQLKDVGTKGPQVVCEIPLGNSWDKIRKQVFSWANVKFPCKPHKLSLNKHPTITVTGKAFFDGEHRGKIDNRRSYDDDVAIFEIHPVMELTEEP